MATCDGYTDAILSTDWILTGDENIGRLCSQYNIDFCVIDSQSDNGALINVNNDLPHHAEMKYNLESFDTDPDTYWSGQK